MAAAARVLAACLLSAGESLAAFSPAQLTVVSDVNYLYYLALVIAAIAGAAALLILWNRTLRLRVAAKTAELSHALESLQRNEHEVLRLNAELEKRIADRTAQLTLANEELRAVNEQLESFSYSISHDLRAPLRHIDGFAKMLREHAQNLDLKSLEFLDTISKSAKWMGRLIDDLLALARTTRQEFHSTPIDLDALVSSAQEQCLHDVRDRKMEWKIERLPAVQGDATLLRAAFVNLLSNAIKFTGRRELAVIEVGALPGDEGEAVIYVKDNGAGFDTRYAKRLFGVFQRMHRQGEFDGTGVGLATVQRIITRHGGRVWADAEPDRGATFYVALRRAAPASTKAA
jgi:light-regulated signal transduction histidine kinase (bacteriophytochrome)